MGIKSLAAMIRFMNPHAREKEGLLPPSIGWDPTRIDASLDVIILGMHAKEDNPELLAAKALSINIYIQNTCTN